MKPPKEGETPIDPNAEVGSPAVPAGVDRRTFLMRNAVIGAAAVMTGTTWTPEARAEQAAKEAAAKPAAKSGAKLGSSPISSCASRSAVSSSVASSGSRRPPGKAI